MQRIDETHRSYDALEYVLFYPHGEDGWHLGLNMSNGKKLSPKAMYSYLLMVRPGVFNPLHYGRRLFQQYIVDQAAKIESERLSFLRSHQAQLRSETYSGLKDALIAADGDATQVGQRVILSSSFIGGPRYLRERQQDAMSYVQHFGRPDLFITMTANPTWVEITRELLPGQQPADRPDLTIRVFDLKRKALLQRIRTAFGMQVAHVCALEYQKRGKQS